MRMEVIPGRQASKSDYVLEQISSENKAQTVSISYGQPENSDEIPALKTINSKPMQLAA